MQMFANDQMRYGATVLAAVFGGPGVFYCLESFDVPSFALTGLIYLGFAFALIWAAQGKDIAPARRKLPPPKRRR